MNTDHILDRPILPGDCAADVARLWRVVLLVRASRYHEQAPALWADLRRRQRMLKEARE